MDGSTNNPDEKTPPDPADIIAMTVDADGVVQMLVPVTEEDRKRMNAPDDDGDPNRE